MDYVEQLIKMLKEKNLRFWSIINTWHKKDGIVKGEMRIKSTKLFPVFF